jgi:acetyl-CoA carboxylase carboxyl transferase subunit alpha
MAAHYLEFERPVAELEAKIEELHRLSETTEPGAFDAEIAALRERMNAVRAHAYAHLDPWQKTQIARHPQRPHFIDYVGGLIAEFVELRGDRTFADDQAIMGGLGRFRGQPVVVIGQEKGHDTTSRLKHNFGMARPEGYRKAVRLMDLAERFNLPVLSFIDTGGAYPGIGGEERGVAEAIARGTAVISPEGCASILLRDRGMAEGAAKAMKITAEDLIASKVVDRVIKEPVGGAHADPALAVRLVGDAVEAELKTLLPLAPDALREQRAQRFLAIGRP